MYRENAKFRANLQLYAYMYNSPIFSSLLIELQARMRTKPRQDTPSRIIALCELLKTEIQIYLPQNAPKRSDPVKMFQARHKDDIIAADKMIPRADLMQAYKNRFLQN